MANRAASGRAQKGLWRCTACGHEHDSRPMAFHLPAPDYWSPDFEGQPQCELFEDTCVIHGEHTLPTYPKATDGLQTMVHTEPVGYRPLIQLEPTEHELAVEQRLGLTADGLDRHLHTRCFTKTHPHLWPRLRLACG